MTSRVTELRSNANYLDHLADEAERRMTPEQLAADRIERVARHLDEDPADPEFLATHAEDIAKWPSLPEALRSSAQAQRQTAQMLEMAEEAADAAEDDYRSGMGDAKSFEWYDDVYQGYCDGLAA